MTELIPIDIFEDAQIIFMSAMYKQKEQRKQMLERQLKEVLQITESREKVDLMITFANKVEEGVNTEILKGVPVVRILFKE